MTDRKLTEAEMISYLELSVAIGSTARLAPEEAQRLLDLIDGKTATNEALCEIMEEQRAEIERLSLLLDASTEVIGQYQKDAETARVEAVKEFAKFLIDNSTDGTISNSDIPDLVIQKTEERTE